jgi:protein-tyrosine phosphatase
MPAILFVCTGNQYRSPVAAAYLTRLLQKEGLDDWRVASAGTWAVAGKPAPAAAQAAAQALGLDLAGHSTRPVDAAMLADYNLILAMEQGQKEALGIEFPAEAPRTYLLAEMLDGPPFDIPDPVGRPDQARQILSDMCDVIQQGLSRLRELALSLSRSGN